MEEALSNLRSAPATSAASDADPVPVELSLTYLPVPSDLEPFVTTFFLARCEAAAIRDIQPAATAQLQVYLSGRGRMLYPSGRVDRSFPETFQAPQSAAAPFEIEGPFHLFGTAIAPLGWAALTGLDAAEHGDRLHDARAMLGPRMAAAADTIRRLYAASPTMEGAELVAPMADFLRGALRTVPADHAALVAATTRWLGSGFSPSLSDLYAQSGYSPRQVQRLVARYFGSTPAHLVRKYRATRVAALLSDPATDEATIAHLEDQFYDQPHMIREIREFIGRTPSRLGDGESPILDAVVHVRNFYQISPNAAPLAALESDADDA
jgi:AraC-like DNA-binding protein